MDRDPNHPLQPPPFWRSRFGIGWIALAAVAVNEERDMALQFDAEYPRCAERTPCFLPRWSANAGVPRREA